MEDVGAGVYRLGSRWLNWYVVDGGGDGLTVVDTGYPGYYEQLAPAFISKVRAIVLTHAHADHLGCAARLQQESRARGCEPRDFDRSGARGRTFADGDLLGEFRVLHTPGHGSFLLEERDVLFSGDALVTRDNVSGRTGPQQIRWNHDAQRALGAAVVLPGHGEPWRSRTVPAG